MKYSKHAQLDFGIITFVMVFVGILIFAPLSLKIFNSIRAGVTPALSSIPQGGAEASSNFDFVMNILVTFWDKIMIFALVVSLILLVISSFMMDTHPVWLILYVIVFFLLVCFIPNMLQSVDNIYNNGQFALETSQLSLTGGLKDHAIEILIGICVFTGIIIFGKPGFSSIASSGRGGGSR